MVPPLSSAGVQRAVAGPRRQVGQRRGQLPQRHVLRVLDVRHDEAQRARHGDAEVDVVLRHHLGRRLVPRRVQRRGTPQGEHHGPGHDGEWRDVDSLEVPVGPQALDELRGRRRIERQEHARLRRRGHAADHGLGHVLLDAAHRRPGLATLAHPRVGGARRRRPGAPRGPRG